MRVRPHGPGRGRIQVAIALVAAAVLCVGTAHRADAQAISTPPFTAGVVVTGDAPPGLIYNLQVSCSFLKSSFSQVYQFQGTGTVAVPASGGCDIVEWYTNGSTAGYTLVSVTKNVITDRVQTVTWVWPSRTGSSSPPTKPTTPTTPTTTAAPVRVPPRISVDPVDFGNLLIGKSATRQTVVRNVGTIAVSARSAAVSPPFSVTQPSCDLQPGATCTVDVTFSPTVPRQEQATLTVSAAGANGLGAVAQTTVTGNSEDRGDVVLSTPQFQPTPVGQTSPVADATLTNVGSLPFNVKSVSATPPFLSIGNKCPILLQPGQTCTLQLAFRPTAPGPATGSVSVSLAGATLLDLRGSLSAVAPTPPKESLVFDPPSGALGDVAQGSPPTKLNVRLVNSGTIPLTVAGVGVPVTSGKGAKKVVRYVAPTGAITVSGLCKGRVLEPQQACDLVITSVNTAPGPRALNLRAVTSLGFVADYAAKGRVLRRSLTITGPVQLGLLDPTTPKVVKVTVTNTGQLPVTVASVALTDPTKTGFSISGDLCSKAALAVGAKCTLNVQGLLTVQPPGVVKDRLVARGTAGETGQADVLARSPGRAIALVPKVLDFGQVSPGATVSRKVAVRNIGDLPVTVKDVVIAGAGAGAFVTVAGANCIGAVVAAKGQCVITVNGVSNTAGAYAATITVTGTLKETASASLRMGVGIAPTTTGTPIQLSAPPTTTAPCQQTLRAVSAGPRGRPIAFSGDGFPANAVVQVGWQDRPPLPFAADANGTISGSIMVFSDEALGSRTLVATTSPPGSCPPTTAQVLIVLDTASPRRPLTRTRPVVR